MTSLGELFRLGITGGCRVHGRHLAKSLSAVAAAGNRIVGLQEAAPPGQSSILGKVRWKHILGHCLRPRSQTAETYQRVDNHSALACLDKGTRSLPCDKGNGQTQGCWDRTLLVSPQSFSKVETCSKTSGLHSHPSVEEQLIDRQEFSDGPKQKDSGQEFHSCGRGDRAPNTEKNVQINFSGPGALLRQDLCDFRHYSRVSNKQRKSELQVRPEKSYSSSGKSKQGRKNSGEGTPKSTHARTAYALNRQISILMETGYREEAFAVYKNIQPGGCKPDSYTYLHLIKGFCQGGNLKEAQELFRTIFAGEDSSCDGSEVILYNAMVHGLGSAGCVKEALNLVEEMTRKGLSPDMYTFNSVLHSLGKVGKVTEALTLFESMAGMGCAPDVVTYNSIINCLAKAGRAMEAYELYEGMIEQGCIPDLVTFNTLVPVLGKTGELDLALNLYKFMATIGCQPDVYTYTSLVNSLCRAKRIDEALLLSVEMTEKGCAPNTVTFNSWLDGLCKGGRVVEAHLLFHKMLVLGYVPDNITYCILINAYCKTGQFVEESFNLLKDLLNFRCVLDRKTADIVYQSFEKLGMLKQAKRITRNARANQSRRNGPDVRIGQFL